MNAADKPLVSVVIPTIRFDDYTHRAIRSIFAQSYTNWEIILVLDGCPPRDVPEYIKQHAQFRLVTHSQRLGTPTSLNDGIAAATGKLIARLDADDIAHPERLKFQVEFMYHNPEISCVGTSGVLIDSAGKYLGGMRLGNDNLDVRVGLLSKNMLTHSSVMYHKDIFEEVGGYSPRMIRMQDYDLFLRMARVGPIAVLGAHLGAYRTHLGQHSRNTSPFKSYTFEILRQRMLLARHLKVSRLLQYGRNTVWYGAQIVRHFGLQKPRYLTEATSVHTTNERLDWLNPTVPGRSS